MTIHDCYLDGLSLSRLDERICVLDIQEDAPEIARIAHPLIHGGQRLHQTRQNLTVRITFAIHEEQPSRRKAVLQAIRTWAAQGGLLTLADRPGQQLQVVCASLPDVSAEDWTAPMTIAFTTTHCPWWEAKTATSVTGSGTLTLTLPGTADTAPVDAHITNASTQTITRLSIQCASTYIIFEGITMPAGSALHLTTERGVFSAVLNGESVLACRTPGSDDLLLAPCGESCTAAATAAQAVTATFTARGRYL